MYGKSSQTLGSLPMCGKCSHIWKVLQYMGYFLDIGSLVIYGKCTYIHVTWACDIHIYMTVSVNYLFFYSLFFHAGFTLVPCAANRGGSAVFRRAGDKAIYITRNHAQFAERFIRTYKGMLYERIDSVRAEERERDPQWNEYNWDI